MKYFATIFTLFSLSFISSCNPFDNEPELPPITTEGKRTFGCLVDGKLFLNEGATGFGNGLYIELQTSVDTIGINIYAGNSSSEQNLIISIFDNPILKEGMVYDLSDPRFFVDYTDYSNTITCRYRNVISGSIKILKFDISNPQNRIIAGTFEFTATSGTCQKTIVVTEGRFDTSDVI